jgi:hypothetical protein
MWQLTRKQTKLFGKTRFECQAPPRLHLLADPVAIVKSHLKEARKNATIAGEFG